MKRSLQLLVAILMLMSMALSACQAPAPVVVPTQPATAAPATAVPATAAPTQPAVATNAPAATQAVQPTATTAAQPTTKPAAGQKPLWGWATPADYEKATGKKLPAYNESPMLAALVKAGTLPPVDKRLPKEPDVDNPFESVGKYGGTMTLGQVASATGYPASNFTTFESLFSLARDGNTVVPNIAKGWKFNDTGTEFTIYLRDGLKWSDGADFTADDIMFYWNDIILNKELTPNVPGRFAPGGEPMKVEKLDQYSVKFTFKIPYFAILPNLSSVVFTGCQGDIFEAAHYLKKFHKTYNPNVETDAKAAGFTTWVEFFGAKRYFWWAARPDVPTMGPWRIVKSVPEGTVLERNPYYYKVDTAGNQLPYIDHVNATIFTDAATLALKMVAGEYDYQDWSTSVADYPTFMDGAKAAGYNVFMAPSLWTSIAAYSINQQYTGDKADAAILQDVRFRQALSLSINRDEINNIIALGQGTPFQATVHPSASYYKDAWGKAFIAYDVKQANSLLDTMGMDKKDGEGYRLRPDGKPFSLIISDVGDAIPPKMSELVKEYWDAVGIRTVIHATDRTLMGQQFTSGEFMVSGWAMDGSAELPVSIGTNSYLQGWQWAPQWNAWYSSNGKNGQEPPADVKKMFELYKQVPFMSPADQKTALTQIFDIWSAGLWRIGTIGMVPKPGIVRIGLKNVDTNTYTDNADVGIGTFNRHYQFYWDK